MIQPLRPLEPKTSFRKNRFKKPRPVQQVMMLLLCATMLSCGPKQGNGSADEANTTSGKEVTVDWYSIPDAGLLSTELRGDSLAFTLLVGAGESCTGESSGVAVKQGDGSYKYGDSDCALTFKTTESGITLEESGDLCDHGAHCSFGGNYTKVVSEKVRSASADVMSWMRKNISDFTCVLENQYGYKSEKYSCGQKLTIDYDPTQPTWNEGPEFPLDKAKAVHPLVKSISVQFEHGDLYMLSVTLENKMIMQDVQRIFSLPNPFDGYGNEKYPNVMSLTFDDHGADDKPQFSLNPVFVSSFTLTGFEHTGAGDILDVGSGGSDIENETTITYEYRETGDTFTLMDEGGPGPYEFTCTGIATVKTSSDLASQGSSSYDVAMMTDMEESTAWAEGKSGLGIGEWIEFTLTDAYKKWGNEDKPFD